MKTLAIGEQKVFTDVTLEVVLSPNNTCNGCWFLGLPNKCHDHPYKCIMGNCAWPHRADGKDVIFKAIKGKED